MFKDETWEDVTTAEVLALEKEVIELRDILAEIDKCGSDYSPFAGLRVCIQVSVTYHHYDETQQAPTPRTRVDLPMPIAIGLLREKLSELENKLAEYRVQRKTR